MKIEEACRAAKEFLESAGHRNIELSSAVPVWRITADTGFMNGHEFEILLDQEGKIVQFRRLDDEKKGKPPA